MRQAPFIHRGEKDELDHWSTALETYGKFGGRLKSYHDVGSPGQCAQKTTLALGSGRTYDKAEAARIAAAERAALPHHTAYPTAGKYTKDAKSLESTFGRHQKGKDGKILAAPITVNLSESSPTWTPYQP